MVLHWKEKFDSSDNSVYVASSCLHDEGAYFVWCVAPTLMGNQVRWWIGQSDPELTGDQCFEDMVFDTVEAAKNRCAYLEQAMRAVAAATPHQLDD